MSLDIRAIASVDASITAALEEGRLRPDLHERLSFIRVDVPSLRQRREDIRCWRPISSRSSASPTVSRSRPSPDPH